MTVHRLGFGSAQHQHRFIGTWHIYAMQMWDASAFNAEVQAFVQVRADNTGSFQFCLVSGEIDGTLEGTPPDERFAFTWGGADEMEPVHGRGWLRLKTDDEMLGLFHIHGHDRSKFRARRVP